MCESYHDNKKADVMECLQAFQHVGLLVNEPPGGRVALYLVFRHFNRYLSFGIRSFVSHTCSAVYRSDCIAPPREHNRVRMDSGREVGTLIAYFVLGVAQHIRCTARQLRTSRSKTTVVETGVGRPPRSRSAERSATEGAAISWIYVPSIVAVRAVSMTGVDVVWNDDVLAAVAWSISAVIRLAWIYPTMTVHLTDRFTGAPPP